jgi:hypothetical protein
MVYKDMTMYGITDLYTEWFRVCTNRTSTFRSIAMFRGSVQENNYVNKTCFNDSNNTCRYVHDALQVRIFVPNPLPSKTRSY